MACEGVNIRRRIAADLAAVVGGGRGSVEERERQWIMCGEQISQEGAGDRLYFIVLTRNVFACLSTKHTRTT